MSNAVAIHVQTGLQSAQAFTTEQVALIRDTVAKGASPDELKLFMYRAQSMGLDPLKPGQVHFVKYGNSPGSIIVGIEGFRSIAHRTGKLSGIKRGAIKDEKGALIGAWAEVYRTDWTHPAREEVPLSEYAGSSPIWRKMPETMIKKVAECATLRMAFPNDLGGVYSPEEMDQADSEPPKNPFAAGAVQPTEADGVLDDGIYRVTFGKFAKRKLEEIDPKEISNYIDYLERTAEKKGETIKGKVAEFIDRASAYLGALENAVPEEEDLPF